MFTYEQRFGSRIHLAAPLRSDRREEFVQIERQRVELLAPRVFLEAPELFPPVVASVLPHRAFLYLKGVVQDVGYQPSDERL